jgi:nickel superoxide dismutase
VVIRQLLLISRNITSEGDTWMKATALVVGMILIAIPTKLGLAHCEVPCGIYGDQRRFENMLEDQETIAKAITSLKEMLPHLGEDALSVNQAARWVSTKEAHATNIQHTIAQYFLTQRIKADGERYQEKLMTAHAVMVTAMKCKQTVDETNAESLRQAILKFHAVYEGKPVDTGGK